MGKHKYVKEMCNVRIIAIHSVKKALRTMGAELFGVVTTTSVDENKLLRESGEDFGRRKSASQRLVVR